ncbi:hypothetical protein [Cellulomonas alba]|uniref:DNA-binding protein n=1 Tax=Cellulomonas alba TaxID=3053467 RepID=A0ABT7SC58_9CELL|nr:hypothetical protein [Cellulomonas alba]MDM7853654.1 hypothetical protein [Cellulomonas alba]
MGASITLQDIAIATGVTRQAVTNWRRRTSVFGSPVPFPAPVDTVRGVERFDRDEVLAWLQVTGRGRNDQVELDAPALTPPDDATLDDTITLLALRSQTARDIAELSRDELARLAIDVDPHDEVLAAEVSELDPSPQVLAYVDELLGASYGPGDALDRLTSSRLFRERGGRGLSREGVELLVAVIGACVQHIPGAAVAFDAAPEVLACIPDGTTVVLPSDRAARRRLMIRNVPTTPDAPSVVRAAVLLGADDAVLDRIDDIADELPAGSVAVVLGPASVLCDRLRGADARRRRTLQVGNLVAAIRLPRGMWTEAHRLTLALWVLHAGAPARRVLLADLTGRDVVVDDVVDDVLGALEQSDRRQYRYGRALPYDRAVDGDPLVPAGIAPARLPGVDPGHRDAVTAATLVTSLPVDGFDILVAPAAAALATAPRSLGQMVDERSARKLRGSRIDPAHTETTGTTRILSAVATEPTWQIDPLVAAMHYGHALPTEPGDVVVATSPRPSAVVDEVGGALVRSPSFILRLTERAGIGPLALAEWINLLPEPAGDWRAWAVPRLSARHVDDVEAALTTAVAHLGELRRREDAMHDLIRHLVQGVAVGDLALLPTTNRKAG